MTDESEKETRALDSAHTRTVLSRRQQTQPEPSHGLHQQQSLPTSSVQIQPTPSIKPDTGSRETTLQPTARQHCAHEHYEHPKVTVITATCFTNHALKDRYYCKVVLIAAALHSKHGAVADDLDRRGTRVWAQLLCHRPAGLPRSPFEHLSRRKSAVRGSGGGGRFTRERVIIPRRA